MGVVGWNEKEAPLIATTDFEILPELRDCLPGQTEEELRLLRESLSTYGMRNGIEICRIEGYPGKYILDGHTRYRLSLELGIAWKLGDDVFHFATVEDAICWVIENQRGRRKLTADQDVVIMKRYYEAKKKPLGTNQFNDERVCKNYTPISTAEEVAREYGVSPKTVHNAVNKAKKFDDLGLTDAVMSGEIKSIPNPVLDDIMEAVEAEPERKEEIVAEVIESAKENNGRVKSPHVANNSGDNEWYTPPEFVEAAREVMGSITLDPATSPEANEVVQAYGFFTAEDNGLEQDWTGNIWMNPPYSSDLIGKFVEKLAAAVEEGSVQQAVVLVNNATETKWFARLASVSSMLCFPTGRIKFWHPRKESTPLQGQAIAYIGGERERFRKRFKPFGIVAEVA
jgi:phage N-6-adenine-methyltransferase